MTDQADRDTPPNRRPSPPRNDPHSPQPIKVPAGRVSRLLRLGSLTAGIAGGAALQAIGGMARGTRPDLRGLLVTPGNVRRLADELARMRGAAMKLGQLLSMDAGEILPPELAQILARLRDQAHIMPPSQLGQVLEREWGPGWRRQFRRFDVRPIAAASIGQVHRAWTKDGRDLAIKVQYPGVDKSIDSDVTNVGALLRLSGLLPKGFNISPYLAEARRQLHEETDYAREGAQLNRFAEWLDGSDSFALPRFHADLSTSHILAMSFIAGRPIETLADTDVATRDRVMTELIDLTLREVFVFGAMQSDPNFANYLYDADTKRIVLLDFGAARDLDPAITHGYADLLRAGLSGDAGGLRDAAVALGMIQAGSEGRAFDARLLALMARVFEALGADHFDFTDQTLLRALNAEGIALAQGGYHPPSVPMDVLYLQRKFGGLFLLGNRLRANLPLRRIIEPHL
jgi:predicted unusual protein kinase regulating ubiquinone biosynthesis (AarF/ABC1/UbiB family)